MSATVTVHLTPPTRPLPPGGTAVIIDVLRATTTLTVALAAGAAGVVPAGSPAGAEALAAGRPGALRCGERGGLRIPGFDLGNSPFEYTTDRVAGRELVFASTNGSLAMIAAEPARRRILAAFVNAGAALARVRAAIARRPRDPVVIVCAGKEGRFSLEDAGLAGWLCAALGRDGAALDATAHAAAALAPDGAAAVRALVEGTGHARDLRELGPAYAADVAFAATLDAVDAAFEV